MSISLSSTNNITYGDLAVISGATALTFSIRFKVNATIINNTRIINQWGLGGSQAFLIATQDTDEIGFVLTGSSGSRFGKKTTGISLVNGEEYGCVLSWKQGTPNVIRVIVNGIEVSLVNWFTSDIISIKDVSVGVDLGKPSTVEDGVGADYQDFAIWKEEIPLEVARSISLGVSPKIWQSGLSLYDSLVSVEDIKDEIGGVIAATTGTTAPQLPTYFPSSFATAGTPEAVGGVTTRRYSLSLTGVG